MKKSKEAFLAILDENRQIIFKVCNMYCRDKEDEKDLVQDVIIQLWNSFEKFDGRVKISTWIYRIALNVAISFYRKSKTRANHSADFDESFLQIAPSEGPNYDEQIDLLKQFINNLDQMHKALMILYLDGNSHEEIANILNISKSNVGTKINRIKQKLKVQFENINTL
ncbi:sigma-70 family RNA polymerase sigma factor [Fulvivirga sp. RKSG066]|uniref:RNA polymerase sigma factor n=1 Tax=Fulvivirga aurantia TaxID=2529383 RepID=UPI0012BB8E70|nr:sigma-70 family RNA polymerase sigma factor [Fulvivirga aurantia]MTI20986.1 sigma-70 family RNA polymerase sigma factor [Fulvivirga aurantia]